MRTIFWVRDLGNLFSCPYTFKFRTRLPQWPETDKVPVNRLVVEGGYFPSYSDLTLLRERDVTPGFPYSFPPPFLFLSRTEVPARVPVTGVRYSRLIWMCALNTLSWPDLTSSVVSAFIHCAMGRWIDLSWWTHWAISHSNQCPTTGVTKAVLCDILSVGWCI